jgi:hypothetical protein
MVRVHRWPLLSGNGAMSRSCTEPVEDAVGRHQRRRLQITDKSVISDIRITSHRFLFQAGARPNDVGRARYQRPNPSATICHAGKAGITQRG